MTSKQLISRDIETFYTNASEETRLEKGMGIFEFERVKSLLQKYISSSCSRIIDVGGGTGKYSEWLAKKGHQIHLIDPVPKHIEIAKRRSRKLKNKFTVHLGEARMLDLPNDYADIVILHGPLYHLQKQEDREKAILEARRVLKRGGTVLAFAINYSASTIVGLMSGLIHKKSFFDMCSEELRTGIHNPPTDLPWLLAEAYYHKPSVLKSEFEKQKFLSIKLYAVEGIAWLDNDLFTSLVHQKRKKTLLDLIAITENDASLLALNPHMMLVAQK